MAYKPPPLPPEDNSHQNEFNSQDWMEDSTNQEDNPETTDEFFNTQEESIEHEKFESVEESAGETDSQIVDAVDPATTDELKEEFDEEDELGSLHTGQTTGWGYGFVLIILLTIFGSITVATYLVLLKTKVLIPSILVNISIIALLCFLVVVIGRYLLLIYLSFMHHARSRNRVWDESLPKLKASILVPAYNEELVIGFSIRRLLEMDYPNFEVIVIDDGSSDRTHLVAKQWEGMHGHIPVRVVTQKNRGKAAALNHGLKIAKGQIVVCMDADSYLAPQTLNVSMRHFMDGKISAVAGNVKISNRVNMLTRLQALEYIEGLNLVRRAQAFFRAVNIIPGPIGLFRRDALLDVGGWDSDTYAEDCDLTLKLLTHGHKVDYEPEAISYTEAPKGLIQLLKQRYRWTRGILQSMRKYKSFLINPAAGFRVVITLWQMVMESILWPLMNIMANLLFLTVAILYGMSPLIVLWWVQLTILDTIAAMHTIAIEKEDLYLIFYAIIYRVVFVQIVDFAKLAATIEEMFSVKMSWGKLDRTGQESA